MAAMVSFHAENSATWWVMPMQPSMPVP